MQQRRPLLTVQLEQLPSDQLSLPLALQLLQREAHLYGANLFYRLAPNVLAGWEVSQIRTTYLGQGIRINNHYDLALAYHF